VAACLRSRSVYRLAPGAGALGLGVQVTLGRWTVVLLLGVVPAVLLTLGVML